MVNSGGKARSGRTGSRCEACLSNGVVGWRRVGCGEARLGEDASVVAAVMTIVTLTRDDRGVAGDPRVRPEDDGGSGRDGRFIGATTGYRR